MKQSAQIQRVNAAIGTAVCEFMRETNGREFHADDLRNYVEAMVGHRAPSSPTRIMQHLRKGGMLSYELVSRAQSLYLSRGVTYGAPAPREENVQQT